MRQKHLTFDQYFGTISKYFGSGATALQDKIPPWDPGYYPHYPSCDLNDHISNHPDTPNDYPDTPNDHQI